MAMTPAEKQAAYRERQRKAADATKARIAELEQEHREKQQPPQQPNLGPNLPLTPEEVEHLRQCLQRYRKEQAERAVKEVERKEHERAAREKFPEIDRQMKEKERVVIEHIEPGTYYTVIFDRSADTHAAIEFVVTVDGKGRRVARTVETPPALPRVVRLFRRPASPSGWSASVNREQSAPVHRHRADAEREAYTSESNRKAFAHATRNGFNGPPRPFKDMPDADLRKLRSHHHPDRNKPDRDPAIYQQAVEELDRRRKT